MGTCARPGSRWARLPHTGLAGECALCAFLRCKSCLIRDSDLHRPMAWFPGAYGPLGARARAGTRCIKHAPEPAFTRRPPWNGHGNGPTGTRAPGQARRRAGPATAHVVSYHYTRVLRGWGPSECSRNARREAPDLTRPESHASHRGLRLDGRLASADRRLVCGAESWSGRLNKFM